MQLFNIIKNILLLIFGPKPPSSLTTIKYIGEYMSKARVQILWEPSKSTDVISQKLVIMINKQDEEPKEYQRLVLMPTANEYVFYVEEKTYVNVKLTAFDGTFESIPMVNNFYVPDLTVPLPPIDKGWKTLEVEQDLPNY